jgi:hypothetical protein
MPGRDSRRGGSPVKVPLKVSPRVTTITQPSNTEYPFRAIGLLLLILLMEVIFVAAHSSESDTCSQRHIVSMTSSTMRGSRT